MLRSYLRLAIRTLRRRLRYTTVNVVGLTVGLACCALVAVFLQYELSWDAHHEHSDRTYRVVSDYPSDLYSSIRFEGFRTNDDDPTEQRSLPRRLVQEVPAVEQAANYTIFSDYEALDYIELPDGRRFESPRRLATNTGVAFMDLFTFEQVAGPPLKQAFAEPGAAVLTRSTAQKYFGDQSPVGKTITVNEGANSRERPLTVQAVIADPPSNSRLQFGIAMHVKKITDFACFRYLRLTEGANPATVAPKVEDVMTAVNPALTETLNWQGAQLQPLTDIYLGPPTLYDKGPNRNPAYLWVFGAIALLILTITTINYANLGLALYADRNEEIGVRKAIGGHGGQIAGQFLTEAVLLAVLCVPLALAVCAAVLPAFNALMGIQIAGTHLFQPTVLGTMVGLAVLTGGAAGSYPAFVLARTRAVDLFGRSLSSGRDGRSWSLRHGLIAFQFVVLIALGSLSWIANDQLQYMQRGDLGYPAERIVEVNSIRNDSTTYQRFRQRVLESSAVAAVGMGDAPRSVTRRVPFTVSGEDQIYEGGQSGSVDVHWFEVMGIEHPVIDSMRAAGPTAPERHLLNQAAADLLRTNTPVGETWTFNPRDPNARDYRIDGVIPNLQLNSMRKAISPRLFTVYARPPWAINALVRFVPGRTEQGMERVRQAWADLRPDTPLRTTFLSDKIAGLYEQERRFGTLATALSLLAILLAALGLASLVAYLTRLRMKEIGVRKALGGSVTSIVALLNREYVRIVAVAFVVGAPLAWIAADWWLGQFADRIGLSVGPFLVAGVGALVVAVAAVSTQALRAARVDPAQVLRSE